MARRRTRTTTVASLLLAVALLTAACTNGSEDASSSPEPTGPTETTDRSSGGPAPTGPDESDPEESGGGASPVEDGIRVEVLSSQPDRASGPDARVRITPAQGMAIGDLIVTLGDRDVTSQLTAADGRLEGVVNGLVEGNNSLTVTANGESVTQRIRSWPLSGPMFSGPQQPLLACSTEAHDLGPATDDDCSAPTKVTWQYVAPDDRVRPLTDPSSIPDDVQKATIDGAEVPLVIRFETGVINRSVYEIASIDPSPGGSDASQDDAAWSGDLIYRYGSGCAATHGQGETDTTALARTYLAKGYAVATATFNSGSVQCNDVISAETTMMVKERFIEEFGRPDATIGEGSGWGAAQIHLIAQNYPGLLDGAVALDPFPDLATMAGPITDCGLLDRYFNDPDGTSLTPEQRQAITGFASPKTCTNWAPVAQDLIDPTVGCDPAIAPEEIYAAGSNPTGIRCTYQDESANQYGRDEATGFAFRPLDNVGLQYGLAAFDAGTITFDEFAALNDEIGGYDLDGAPVPERTSADPFAVQSAYETGRVSTGVGDQPKIPIIDVSVFDDPSGAVTDHVRPFALRDRLVRGGPAETTPGFRIWTRDPDVTPSGEAGREALTAMTDWLQAIDADTDSSDRTEQLRRTRPEAALDSCLPPGADAPITATELYDDKGPCRDDYPISGDPRIAAGARRSGDVIKCQLKTVDPNDYEADLTDAQVERLVEVFPEGVCDWDQAGTGQTSPSMTDRTYDDVITPGELA